MDESIDIRDSMGNEPGYVRPIPEVQDERGKIVTAATSNKLYSAVRSKWSTGLSIWVSLLAQAIRGALWIWLYMEITYSIPHTFSWEALLSQFGSFCKVKSCSNYKEDCSKELPCPVIPAFFTCFSAVQILIVSFNLIFKRFASSCFIPLKFVVVLEIILFFLVTPSVTTVFIQNIAKLNSTMTFQFKQVLPDAVNEPNLWNVTQHSKQCCGLTGYMDWDLINMVYPESCCDTAVEFCSNGNVHSEYLWTNGCYKLEFDTIVYYSVLELTLLGIGIIVSTLQYYFVKCFVEKNDLEKLISYGQETPNEDLFMQQGSNFISISRNSKTMSLVQVGDIKITATRTILSTVGVIDSLVSMQICNYNFKDQVLLSREVGKLLVTVKRDGIIRGVVEITAPNCHQLEGIRIAANSRGTITVQTAETIYYNV